MGVKTEKLGVIFTVLFFLLFFIVGIMIYDDYGVSVDELVERNTGIVTLKYILHEKLRLESLPDEILQADDLLSYKDKNYGVVLQLPVVLFEYFNDFRFDLSTVVKIRHLWTFLNFYIATIFFYLLIYERFQHWLYSLIAVAFLVLSPRIFGEAFINIKDLLFLSWFIISLYFFIRFVFSPNIKNDIFLGITIALSSNARIIGFVVLFLFCLFLLIKLIRKEITSKRVFLLVSIQFLLTGFLWILFLPASWNNPIIFLIGVIKLFSHYVMILSELYMGNYVFSNQLPWHYLLVWIGISTPILYILFFLFGLTNIINNDKKKFSEKCFIDFSMIFLFLIPIIMSIVLHSTLYNGWRHFYFIYIPFLYIAVYGFVWIQNSKIHILKMLIRFSTIFSLATTLVWMIMNHPYQYVYFNIFSSGYVSKNFEKDYWRLSSKECLEYILNRDENLRISINDYQSYLRVGKLAFHMKDSDRIITSSYVWPANYLIANYTNITGNELKFPFYTPIHHVKVDDMKIASVYQRDHQQDLWGQEVVEKINTNVNSHLTANMFDGDLNSNWMTGKLQNSSDYLDIEFKYPLLLNGLTTYIGENENERPWSLQILSSEDGLNWEPVEIVNQNFIDYEIKEVKTKYLRIKNSEPSEKYTWAVYELLFHGTKLEDG
jgi:hypothetical protein